MSELVRANQGKGPADLARLLCSEAQKASMAQVDGGEGDIRPPDDTTVVAIAVK